MAPIVFPTTSSPDTTHVLVPIWILIAVGAYIVLIILILSIRQCLVQSYSEDYKEILSSASSCCCWCIPALNASAICLEENLVEPVRKFCSKSDSQARGICADCNCFGKSDEEDSCFDCFLACAQFCNCDTPDLRSCCDSICGPRRRCDFGDCATCDCGDGSCEGCSALQCACACQPPDCDQINCLCFEIKT
ncbi:uncharacterized protein LOC143445846 isoform X2 [Clavelina lepadiformis]|uniref:uncharacterized protein LOC143445846 isoform X2 n=1 Tax=Clavelina lepadiformis TaxID=159417 RepID=UPI0040434761